MPQAVEFDTAKTGGARLASKQFGEAFGVHNAAFGIGENEVGRILAKPALETPSRLGALVSLKLGMRLLGRIMVLRLRADLGRTRHTLPIVAACC